MSNPSTWPTAAPNRPIEELTLAYDPVRLAEKVRRRKGRFRGRVISLVLTVVIMIAIYAWQRGQFSTAIWVLYAVTLAISVVWALVQLLFFLQSRRELARVPAGPQPAVRIGRPGVEVAGLGVAWPDVAELRMVKGRLGRSESLRLSTTTGARAGVPLDQISVFPATLDTTARAYSGGRRGVDLSALEN